MNHVTLIGRLGADPDIRNTPGGTTIANLRLATNERRKQGNEWVDETEWHRVVAFGKTAETLAQHFTKGSEIAIEGSIRTNKWTDKDGKDRYTTEIMCNRLHFVGGKRSDARQDDRPQQAEKPAAPLGPDDEIPF